LCTSFRRHRKEQTDRQKDIAILPLVIDQPLINATCHWQRITTRSSAVAERPRDSLLLNLGNV